MASTQFQVNVSAECPNRTKTFGRGIAPFVRREMQFCIKGHRSLS